MDINKYLKNKEIQITNEDIDIESLTNDLRKGFVNEKDITDKLTKNFENELTEKTKELTGKVASLQNDYDALTTKYDESVSQRKTSDLKLSIISNGFKSDDVEEVLNLRTTRFKDITDDNEALSKVKEQYGKVFFDTKVDTAPNEPKMNTTNVVSEPKPVITRNTGIKDLMKK